MITFVLFFATVVIMLLLALVIPSIPPAVLFVIALLVTLGIMCLLLKPFDKIKRK